MMAYSLPAGHHWELERAEVSSFDRFHLYASCRAMGCQARAEFAYGFNGRGLLDDQDTEVFNKLVPNLENPETHMMVLQDHNTGANR